MPRRFQSANFLPDFAARAPDASKKSSAGTVRGTRTRHQNSIARQPLQVPALPAVHKRAARLPVPWRAWASDGGSSTTRSNFYHTRREPFKRIALCGVVMTRGHAGVISLFKREIALGRACQRVCAKSRSHTSRPRPAPRKPRRPPEKTERIQHAATARQCFHFAAVLALVEKKSGLLPAHAHRLRKRTPLSRKITARWGQACMSTCPSLCWNWFSAAGLNVAAQTENDAFARHISLSSASVSSNRGSQPPCKVSATSVVSVAIQHQAGPAVAFAVDEAVSRWSARQINRGDARRPCASRACHHA